MSTRTVWLAALTGLVAFVALSGGGCRTAPEEDESIEPTGPFAELEKLVPKSAELAPWKRAGKMEIFLGLLGQTEPPAGVEPAKQKKFAESPWAVDSPLFAEYRHKMTLTRAFTMKTEGGVERLALQIHEMSHPDEAFGIASVQAGEPQAGSWLAGKKTATGLSFAKGRYFVRVEKETPGVPAEALSAVAGAVAAKIFEAPALPGKILEPPSLPPLAAMLPAENLVAGSLVYLHGPEGLKRADALLGLKMEPLIKNALGESKMVLATYRPLGAAAGNTIFVIDRYGGSGPLRDALESYLNNAPPQEQNRFAYQLVGDKFIVGTLSAEEESVERVLPKLIKLLESGV